VTTAPSFIAAEPVKAEADLPHASFWPAISPTDFREVMAVDGTVTAARLKFALVEAVVLVNASLKDFRLEAEAAGVNRLSEIVEDEPGRLDHLYRRAVFERAKGDLMEKMLTFSATADGQKKAEQQEPAIDDHYRNSLWAIRDILGVQRTTVELI